MLDFKKAIKIISKFVTPVSGILIRNGCIVLNGIETKIPIFPESITGEMNWESFKIIENPEAAVIKDNSLVMHNISVPIRDTDTGINNVFTADKSFSINVADLWQAIQLVKPAMHDETRPHISSVLLSIKNKVMSVVATDATVLAIQKQYQDVEDTTLIVPRELITKIEPFLSLSSGSVDISYNDKKVSFENDTFYISGSLVRERYPDYEQVIPQSLPFTCVFNTKEWLNILKSVSSLSNKYTKRVDITINKQDIIFTIQNSDTGYSCELKASCSSNANNFSFGMRIPTLMTAISNVNSSVGVLSFSDNPNGAFKLEPKAIMDEDKNCLSVVMPLRTCNE